MVDSLSSPPWIRKNIIILAAGAWVLTVKICVPIYVSVMLHTNIYGNKKQDPFPLVRKAAKYFAARKYVYGFLVVGSVYVYVFT